MSKINLKRGENGFTFMETIIYISIMVILLTIVSSTVINTTNARKHLRASEAIQHNARFIINFMANRVHNVSVIDVVSPAPEQIIFYDALSTRFSLTQEGGNLLYRITTNTGSGWPAQSSATPMQVNSGDAVMSNFILTTSDDNFGGLNKGINVSFTLTTGHFTDKYSYQQENFTTFISVR